MIETASRSLSSWPSAAASISLGATIFLTTMPSDRGIRHEIENMPTVVEDPLFGALLALSLLLGFYVVGSLVLSFCNLLRKTFDPNEYDRFHYMMTKASERQYSEWKNIEVRTQIVISAFAIFLLATRSSLPVTLSNYAAESWQSQTANIVVSLLLLLGFVSVIRKVGSLPYRQLDSVIQIGRNDI